jgi:hypothetical protein
MDIIKGNIIQVISTVNPGLNQTVSVYKWTLDATVLPDNSANITINTSSLSLGAHTLLLSAQNSCGNWGSYSESFNIIGPTYGSVIVTSSPSSANIFLDNILQAATTPATITGVPAGSHTYLLRLSGYNDATGTVTVTAGQTVSIYVILSPASYAAWIASMGGSGAIKGNLAAVGNIIDGYLGMVNLGFTVTLGNVGTTIDYYLGV